MDGTYLDLLPPAVFGNRAGKTKRSRRSLARRRRACVRAGGTTAGPLDGGVLNRGRARAPARGPAVAPFSSSTGGQG
jgi:hypothetical protein